MSMLSVSSLQLGIQALHLAGLHGLQDQGCQLAFVLSALD
jgi:hypothetical protein